MARRRYLSTDISTDFKVNQLSDRAALLYTWATPHFADDCRITPQNAAEVKMLVIPGRDWTVDQVKKAMDEIFLAGLWGRDENGKIFIPSKSFYKYQTYINAANRRETPQIAASPSPSPSPKEDNTSPLQEAKKWPDPYLLIEKYNAETPDQLPAVEKITPARLKKARDYLKIFPEENFWTETFREIGKSDFLKGLRQSNGHGSFKADFDWLLTKGKDGTENVAKVFEGRYNNGH